MRRNSTRALLALFAALTIPLFLQHSADITYAETAQEEQAEGTELLASGSCGDALTYTLSADGTLTISGTGSMTNWSGTKGKRSPWAQDYAEQVTSVVVEEGVTDLGEYAFYQCTKLTDISLPSGLTTIGKYACYGCESLPVITIPSSVESIGTYAFSGCKALTDLSLPSGLTTLGASAFQNCTALASMQLPAAITKVPASLMRGCSSLTAFAWADQTTEIGTYAFSGCGSLAVLEIPDTVTKLGTYAFQNCTALTSVTVPAAITELPANCWNGCSALQTVSLPEKLKTVGDSAFANCSALSELSLPNTVTKIGKSAFSGCAALTSTELPSAVTSIGEKAFSGAGLTAISLPAKVTTLGANAFEKNTSLTQVTIAEGLKKVSNSLFAGCTALESIQLPQSVTEIGTGAFSGCTSLKEISMPGVTAIGGSAFLSCTALENPGLPSGLVSIASSAYKECTGLKTVVIPASVTTMKTYAFAGCTGLTEVTLEEGVTALGELVFSECTGLKQANLPSTLTELSPRAFNKCGSLTEISVSGSQFVSENGAVYSADRKTLVMWVPGMQGKAEIAAGTETIGDHAFANCTGLTEVTIPDSVTSIGENAFDYCGNLTAVTLPQNLTAIGKQAFRFSGLTDVSLPSGVTTIASGTFASCKNLKQVQLPDTLEKIEASAFVSCEMLQEVTLPASVSAIGSMAFQGCSAIRNVTIPGAVTAIPASLFSGCSALETITLSDTLKSIGSAAFQDCTNLCFVYYAGSEEELSAVKVTAKNNDAWTNAVHICGYQGQDAALSAAEISVQPQPAAYQKNAETSPLTVSVKGTGTEGEVFYFNWFQTGEAAAAGGTKLASVNEAYASSCTPAADTIGTTYYYCTVTRVVNGYVAPTVSSDAAAVAITIPLSGSGTEADPYQIGTASDFELLYQLVKDGNSLSGVSFLMTADITLPENWQPIGTLIEGASNAGGGKNMLPFSGTLDGGDHTLTIPEGGLPLFGYVRGATVKNLNIYGTRIEGCGLVNNYERDYGPEGSSGSEFSSDPIVTLTADHITLKSGSATRESGLIGEANAATTSASGRNHIYLSNCSIEKGVTIGYNQDEKYIGSFAGRLNGSLTNCVSYADVYGDSYVGGLVGIKDTSMGMFSIKNCAFEGTVTATGSYAGGILGSGYPSSTAPNTPCVTITNCYASCTISAAEYVGGILGAEPVVSQCWSNGIGYILNNHFSGSISAPAEAQYVGGVIGYIKSLNCYTNIENNYFLSGCGAERGIGGVLYVDTSAETHETASGAVYFSTAGSVAGCPDVYGCSWQVNSNRTDDPLGADASQLAAAAGAQEFADGTVLSKLNGYEQGLHNWVIPEGGSYPVQSEDPQPYRLEISGEYKQQYLLGETLDLSGLICSVTWTDGSVTQPGAEELTVSGYDSTQRGVQELRISYGSASAKITVTVLKASQEEQDTITVSFALLGDSVHGTDGEVHTLRDQNLTEWIGAKEFTVDVNATAQDVFELALREAKLTWEYGSGSYVDAVTSGGVRLAAKDNGTDSGWMYTLNGVHSSRFMGEQYLEDGDILVFHYTDDYNLEPERDQENQAAAAAVETQIRALPETDALTPEDKEEVDAAAQALEALSAEQKALVPTGVKELLAEKQEQIRKLEEGNRKVGDLTGDGILDIADVSLLQDLVTEGETAALSLGDLNGDGVVNMTDISLLLDLVTAA